jgi:hypothetical protein
LREQIKIKDELNLREAIEGVALGICIDYNNKEKRIEEIIQECKILDSLTNALIAISPVQK